MHSCAQVYQLSHAHIYAHFNLQYRIVLVTSKTFQTTVWRVRQVCGHGLVMAYHANVKGHDVKVIYAHDSMEFWQDITNAFSQFPDNLSVCAQECAQRALEVTHWKLMTNFFIHIT